jgi:hypothetical protein
LTILCGPYIGSIEKEIEEFLPHVNWVASLPIASQVYVAAPENSSFLYPTTTHIPLNIDRNKSMDVINYDVSAKQYRDLCRNIVRKIVSDNKNCIVEHNFLKYKKNANFPFDKKIYQKLPIRTEKTADVVLVGEHYKFICDQFNVHNIVCNDIFYFIKRILSAKAIICEAGTWTMLSNLHNIPVFSWGENINPYKRGGIFNFNNKNVIIPSKNKDVILSGIEYFLSIL